MTRICWIGARGGTDCSVNLTASAFHSSTTSLVTAGFGGGFRCVLAPVAHPMFNNGHTDIKKTAMTAVSAKTSPLLMWLTLMFLLFLPGFLPVKAGLAEKRCNAMSKKFCRIRPERRNGRDDRIFRIDRNSCDILWAL